MHPTKFAPIAVLLAMVGSIACGGEAANGQSGIGNVEAHLESSDAFCFGQKAELPASGTVMRSIAATHADLPYRQQRPRLCVLPRGPAEAIHGCLSFAPGEEAYEVEERRWHRLVLARCAGGALPTSQSDLDDLPMARIGRPI